MYEVQTLDCGGIARAEYRYEPRTVEDEPVTCPLVCGQCDYYRVSNICALLGYKRKSTSLACSEIKVTCPF